MDAKQRAAEAALALVADGMVLGLGTGSTADCFLVALAAALRQGTRRSIRGVATSLQSERRALELGIPLTSLGQCPQPDLTVDGADEIAPNLDLIKGMGGALLREKIVAQNSRRLVIIADSGKLVPALGSRSPLPVEVAAFGHEAHQPFLQSLGCQPILRRRPDGQVYVTDNGNLIYDCRFATPIADAAALELALCRRAGVVDTGLFLGMANLALIADGASVRELAR